MAMKKHLKQNLIIFAVFAAAYFLFNYIPLKLWIENEFVFLGIKIGFYGILSGLLIWLKHKCHIEIEVPEKQINILWLLPLLIICFAHPLYALLFNQHMVEEVEVGVLVFDAATDIFVSIVEDIVFVDLYISLLMELFHNNKYKRIISIMIAALTFTLAHCYTFMYFEWREALVILITVFFLIVECGYAAIYFDSPIIPIVLHAVFNELNFVIFEQLFHVDESKPQYSIFLLVVLALTCCYLAAIYKMSTLQKFKPDFHEEELE